MGAELARLRARHRAEGAPTAEERIVALDRLASVLKSRKDELTRAVSSDFGQRSRHETLVTEVFVVLEEIRHAKAHLAEWMRTQTKPVNLWFLPARAEVRYQPLGVVGVISPWNYPVQLALAPIAGAIAAGNKVMLKPSELTPATSEVLRELLREALGDDTCSVVTGGPEVGEAFSKLAFDHLVFTGSTRVGKYVMRAASENLVPVTLELGGKSPAIVGPDADLGRAAAEIATGKMINAGQTCIAPDYVLVPEAKRDWFVTALKRAVAAQYPSVAANADYSSIVSAKHYDRLRSLLEEAKAGGATLVEINPANETLDPAARKLPLTLVLDAAESMGVLQEELFGPVLPIVTYRTLSQAIDYVNDHPRPLALYYFGDEPEAQARVLEETVSGGVTVNATLLHIAQDELPFGGVGPSGMGAYHGRYGFETFSKAKPVVYQPRVNALGLMRAPYGRAVEALLKVLLR